VAKLNSLASRFSAFARESGLALNAGKMQLLFSAGSGNVNAAAVTVDGKKIVAKDTIELLGVKFDRRFGTAEHEKALVAAVRQCASVIKRLSNHLPRSEYLRQLSTGLVIGKMSHGLLAVYTPRLAATTGTEATKTNAAYKAVQVAMNDVARSVTGSRRLDHVPVANLLARAGIPSTNTLGIWAVAMDAWSCFHSVDGRNGVRNPVGALIFDLDEDKDRPKVTRSMRAATAGLVKVPLRGEKTFISHAARIWNACPDLRAAKTRPKAKRAAAAAPL
jgi:hypothetical protein